MQHHKGERVGSTGFYQYVLQGSPSHPNLGTGAIFDGEMIKGQSLIRAFVGGEIVIAPQFTWGSEPRFLLCVDASVDGKIAFLSTREGPIIGCTTVAIRGSIGGDFRLIDNAIGGAAKKDINVRAVTTGSLDIILGDGGNFCSFELDIWGPRSGNAQITSSPRVMQIRSDTISPSGDRRIVVAARQ